MPLFAGGGGTAGELATFRDDTVVLSCQTWDVAEWVYFIFPPRDDFAESLTAEEQVAWEAHFRRLQRLLADGTLILAGPTLGRVNTGLVIFEAPDEPAARRVMEDDPTISGGFARGELRPFRVSLLRGGGPGPGRPPDGKGHPPEVTVGTARRHAPVPPENWP